MQQTCVVNRYIMSTKCYLDVSIGEYIIYQKHLLNTNLFEKFSFRLITLLNKTFLFNPTST